MDPDFEVRANALIAASNGAIYINSGDRDTATQQRLWDAAVLQYGPDEARNWVAPPGNSFHEKGKAIDFGGDLDLLARLAPQFGLYQPMDWEPWHYEPAGSRDGTESPATMSQKPVNPSSLYRKTRTRDYGDVMKDMFNIRPYAPPTSDADITFTSMKPEDGVLMNPGFLTPELMGILGPLTLGGKVDVAGTGIDYFDRPENRPRGSSMPGRPATTNPNLASFMAALRDVESSGNYRAEGVPTPWGTATGAYQYLDGTWDNYKGYRRAMDAPAEIQDEKAAADMQAYYDEYGSWGSVSSAWYSGPGGNWQSGEVREYVGKVNSRL